MRHVSKRHQSAAAEALSARLAEFTDEDGRVYDHYTDIPADDDDEIEITAGMTADEMRALFSDAAEVDVFDGLVDEFGNPLPEPEPETEPEVEEYDDGLTDMGRQLQERYSVRYDEEGEYCGSCGHMTYDDAPNDCDCDGEDCACQRGNRHEARRYSGVPLVCDRCGVAAAVSRSGGLDGHTMLCTDCDDERKNRKSAAREDLALAERGTVVTAENDYPELDGILWDRPDLIESVPVEVNNISMWGRKTASKEAGWRVGPDEDPYAPITNYDDGNEGKGAPVTLRDVVEDPDQPWFWRKVTGPALLRMNDALDPAHQVRDIRDSPRKDWCRFRRDGYCFYPKDLDVQGTEEAGYAVWIPYNRGRCPRTEHAHQVACEVSEPGPDSGERKYAPDATYRWSEGGQRWDRRYSSLDKSAKLESVMYHLADDVNFQLDPSHRPENNTTWGGDMDPGIFLSDAWGVEKWLNGYGYWRPYVVEFDTSAITKDDLREDGGYGTLVDASAYDRLRITRVLPLDGFAREQYGDPGWTESYFDVDLFTGEPLPSAYHEQKAVVGSGYRSPDARSMDAGWRRDYESKVKELLRNKPHAIASKQAAWSDVNAKAKRIRQDGGVRIISDLGATVTAEVRGDNGLYTTSIARVPGAKKVAVWYCSCPWAKYAWDRSEPWKKLEGRKCAHATALLYEMQSQQMFGGDIEEMAEAPAWRTEEPTMDRRDGEVPEEYGTQVLQLNSFLLTDIEAELVLGNIRDAALLAADAVEGEPHARLVAHAAQASADRDVAAAGHRPRHGAFSGQVGGRIRDDLVLTSDGRVFVDGKVIDPQAVLYPTFDPSAGLNFYGARQDHPAERPALLDGRSAGTTRPNLIRDAVMDHLAAMDAGLDELMRAMETNDFTHAGLIIKSSASGRVLLTQRTPFHGDDEETYGKWEFPGGGLDDGEDALSGAIREFEEETGLQLPEGFSVDGHYENGNYVAIVITVPDESWTVNADLLDLETMGIGWFDTEMIEGSDGFVRPELLRVDFDMVREAVVKEAWDEQDQYESDMNSAFWKGQAEHYREVDAYKQRLRDMKDQDVEVVKGRKVPVGTRGRVFWVGEGKWGWRVGIETSNGETHWTDVNNVELVSELGKTSASDQSECGCMLEEDPLTGEERVLTHGRSCPEHPDFGMEIDDDDIAAQAQRVLAGEAILEDEPEPVLNDGVAYGADEPEDSLEAEASTYVDGAPFVPGDDRLAHLAPGGGDGQENEDLAAVAAKFLKESVKTFSPAEQQALIDEGGRIGASNDDMLQIEGTFYEDQMNDEIGFM